MTVNWWVTIDGEGQATANSNKQSSPPITHGDRWRSYDPRWQTGTRAANHGYHMSRSASLSIPLSVVVAWWETKREKYGRKICLETHANSLKMCSCQRISNVWMRCLESPRRTTMRLQLCSRHMHGWRRNKYLDCWRHLWPVQPWNVLTTSALSWELRLSRWRRRATTL